MKRLVVIVVTLIGLTATTSADAHTTIIEPIGSHFPYQQWVDESAMPTPDVTIEVIETTIDEGCPGLEVDYPACTEPEAGKIWLAPEGIRHASPRYYFYHELGHNVDADMLPQWMRERFVKIVGDGRVWDLGGEPELYGPNEQFADTWAQCAQLPDISKRRRKAPLGNTVWGFVPRGGVDGYNRICRMLKKL